MAAPFTTRLSRLSLRITKPAPFICPSCRHQSSFRRMRKALRVKPDPSFLPSKTAKQDHIIFNPPSSVPNVYHTPPKFLPPGDPRRQLHILASPEAVAGAPDELPKATKLPPPVKPVPEQKYHLNADDIAEIRRLRAENPKKWTRIRLAEKFQCSQFFVSLTCSSPEAAEARRLKDEKSRAKWGRGKREAKEDRKLRKALWGKDT